MIPGDLLSAFPHRQFHTQPNLLDSWAALPNSYPIACMPKQGGNLYHFYDGLWYDPAERRTHDLLCERRTRYWLSQTDTVIFFFSLEDCSLIWLNSTTFWQNYFPSLNIVGARLWKKPVMWAMPGRKIWLMGSFQILTSETSDKNKRFECGLEKWPD